jgi:tetratricopeptide (TPR) repeat protein
MIARLQSGPGLRCGWLAFVAAAGVCLQALGSTTAPEPAAPVASAPTGEAAIKPPEANPEVDSKPAFSAGFSSICDLSVLTNAPGNGAPALDTEEATEFIRRLETARFLRNTRQPREAEPVLIELLTAAAPEPVKQSALLELAAVAQDDNDLTRAQQVYSQFLGKWSGDPRVPEILLRQGLLFRRMGLNSLAFAKFYSVMTSALVLKNDQVDYYARLVLQAQMEIAETHYGLGKYSDAAEYFSRLLKQNNPAVNRPHVLYKLVRCHSAVGKHAEAVSEAQDFLAHYPTASEQPEVRFHLALALKELGRNNESLQQVLALLVEQRERTRNHPEVWAYWQVRTGNLIANQLYREGDYHQALEIYQSLVQLDRSPQWQLPVQYQIGITFERLWQPQKATEIYTNILSHEKELGHDMAPSLRTVLDMARWRIQFLQWQGQAESATRRLRETAPAAPTLPVAAAIP